MVKPSPTAIRLLAVFLALHLVFGIWFASITPYRASGKIRSSRGAQANDIGAPDERQHANYVKYLLDGKGFPVLKPGSEDLYETYQSHQPPLYYLVAAGWSKVVGADPSNIETGGRLRWLNVLLGCATVAGAFFLALAATKREGIAVGTAAFVSLLPMNLALSGAVSNDPLLFALSVWSLVFIVRGFENGWSTRDTLTTGVLIGLACLTKTTALALVPVVIAACLLRKELKPCLIMAATTIVIAGGWWIRNQGLYGDPLAMGVFKAAFGNSPQASIFIESDGTVGYWITWVGWWTARSFLGAFGYMDIWLNETGLPVSSAPNALYRIWLAVAVIGSLGWLMFIREIGRSERKVHWLLGVFLAVVVLLFVGFNLTYFQAQARYLFAALPVIALGLALGQDTLIKKLWPNMSEYLRSTAIVMPIVLIALLISIAKVPEEFAKRVDSAAVSSTDSVGSR